MQKFIVFQYHCKRNVLFDDVLCLKESVFALIWPQHTPKHQHLSSVDSILNNWLQVKDSEGTESKKVGTTDLNSFSLTGSKLIYANGANGELLAGFFCF